MILPRTIAAAGAARGCGAVAAVAGPVGGGAVVAADEDGVDGAHGGEAGADDADGVFDNGPDDGVDVGPCCGWLDFGISGQRARGRRWSGRRAYSLRLDGRGA